MDSSTLSVWVNISALQTLVEGKEQPSVRLLFCMLFFSPSFPLFGNPGALLHLHDWFFLVFNRDLWCQLTRPTTFTLLLYCHFPRFIRSRWIQGVDGRMVSRPTAFVDCCSRLSCEWFRADAHLFVILPAPKLYALPSSWSRAPQY